MRFVIINKILFTAIYYENEIPFVAMITFFSAAPFAHWQPIGNAEYTWGPFHVYTIGLFSETGTYQENERPLMLSFKYENPLKEKFCDYAH